MMEARAQQLLMNQKLKLQRLDNGIINGTED
jgi:hypothetical protein